jgi:hypothetical protein
VKKGQEIELDLSRFNGGRGTGGPDSPVKPHPGALERELGNAKSSTSTHIKGGFTIKGPLQVDKWKPLPPE